jgi:hypothetical protein
MIKVFQLLMLRRRRALSFNKVKGYYNYGMFIEKREKELVIHSNEWNNNDKRKYLRI